MSLVVTIYHAATAMIWPPGYNFFFKLISVEHEISTAHKINAEIVKIRGKFRFKTQNLVIYPANKC